MTKKNNKNANPAERMNETLLKTMEYLACFKFVQTSQFIQLGIMETKNSMYRNVYAVLRDGKPAFIKKADVEKNIGYGSVDDVYFLTPNGAEWLDENMIMDIDNIRYLKGRNKILLRDYKHRMLTVQTHIDLKLWLDSVDGKMLYISSYFDKKGSQRKGTQEIFNKVILPKHSTLNPDDKYIMTDMITHFRVNGEEKIIVWEQHNGSDTKRFMEQVIKHKVVLENKIVGEMLGNNKLHRIGCVFEKESIMKATCRRLYELYGDDSDLYKLFIFKTNDQTKNDFYNNWILWNGEITTLLK